MHTNPKKSAYRFIILLSIVSLFSDTAYEGAQSIVGPYFAVLGASGLVVGFISGLGEFIGFGLRVISGYWVDRTEKYWYFAILGYLLIFSIPFLGLTHDWKIVAFLIVLERLGKALRVPSRDAMLSYAGHNVGRGIGFGLHQSFDQMGGVLGPLIITLILYLKKDYSFGFAVLIVPAILMLVSLFLAQKQYPRPQDLEIAKPAFRKQKMPQIFWVYLMGVAFLAAGSSDFPIIAYHLQKKHIISSSLWVPLLYIIAMAISAITAILFGWIYDRKGYFILIISILLSCLFAPLVFMTPFQGVLLGMILWGISMGSQRSLIKAVVGDLIPKDYRGTAYGIFNAGYGVSWLLGSTLIGFLYDVSIFGLIIFSVISQLCAIPFIYAVQKRLKS